MTLASFCRMMSQGKPGERLRPAYRKMVCAAVAQTIHSTVFQSWAAKRQAETFLQEHTSLLQDSGTAIDVCELIAEAAEWIASEWLDRESRQGLRQLAMEARDFLCPREGAA